MAKKRNKGISKTWIVILSIIVFLIVLRLFLPRIVLHYANKSLAGLEGYYGHIYDIDLAIYRGAYQIDSIYINKVDTATGEQVPFFEADMIDLSVEWPALFDGKIVGELRFERPRLIFTKGKSDPEEVQQDTTDFKKMLKDLMPIKVNKFEIINGTVHYRDETTQPQVDVKIDDLDVTALNLNNVKDTALLSSTIRATGHVYKGTLEINVKLDPLADDPTFDMNAELRNTSLPELNKFFNAYGNIDINDGTFGLYTEIASRNRKFTGYVKPVIQNLDVVGPEDKEDSFLRKAWERVVGAVGEILENQKKDQVAAKIPLEGSYDNATVGTWYAVTTVLRNAFIQALYPSLDYQISIGSVDAQKPEEEKGFLEKIFTGDEDKKEERQKRREERKEQNEDNKEEGSK